jgi:hypothetical protein
MRAHALLSVIAALLLAVSCASLPTTARERPVLSVSGNRLVDDAGNTVRLLGVSVHNFRGDNDIDGALNRLPFES